MLTLLLLALSAQVPPGDAPVIESPERIRRDLTGMTKEQLEAEIARLDAARPRPAFPIALMAGGGGGGLALAVVMFFGWIAESLQGACISFGYGCYGATHPNPRVQAGFLGTSITGLVLGVTGLVVGGVLMKLRSNERQPYSDAIEAAELQLQELENPTVEPEPKPKKRVPTFVAPL